MSRSQNIAERVVLIACGLVGPAVALDYGGVTNWTQYIAGLVLVILGALALTLMQTGGRHIPLGRYAFIFPVLICAGYSTLQSLRIESDWVRVLSPATYSAYAQWSAPLAFGNSTPEPMPLSVEPIRTFHHAGTLLLLLPLGFAVAALTRERSHSSSLLIALSVGAAAHSLLGLSIFLFPGLTGSVDGAWVGHRFGSFVNRNNAALMLNLGMASAIGLCAFRFQSLQSPMQNRWSGIIELLGDSLGLVGIVTIVLCGMGLLVGGSRGGLLSMMLSCVACFLVTAKGRDVSTKVAVLSYCMIAGVMMLLFFSPLLSHFETIRRFGVDKPDAELASLSGNARFSHWPDGVRAGIHYLPLGSGAATYRYAYLPFQETGVDATFEHADNLWLELFVEQGFPGLLIVAWFTFVVVRSLFRLSSSTDPIDRGLITAGIFALCCIGFSQTVDFGLLLPGNAIGYFALFATIIARSHSLAPLDRGGETEKRFARLIQLAAAATMLSLGMLGLPQLHRAAANDWIMFDASKAIAQAPSDSDRIRGHLETVIAAADSSPTPELLNLATKLSNHLGRLESAATQYEKNTPQFAEAFEELKNSRRRVRWRNDPTTFPVLPDPYRLAVQLSTSSLQLAPLGIISRGRLASLDFVYQDRERNRLVLDQLRQLQSRSPTQLVRIARLALDGSEPMLAAQCWTQATQINPGLARQAIDLLVADPVLHIPDFINASPESYLMACERLMKYQPQTAAQQRQREDYYNDAIPVLDRASFADRKTQSRCKYHVAEMLFSLERFEQSWERFEQSIDLDPANQDLTIAAINRMIAGGYPNQAAALAKQGATKYSNPERFGQILRKIEQRRKESRLD